ncbi:hypothetical protein MTR_6g078200 [Medicago truncatula]|uniref:Uncharacterized protein n=1 Tax=Medicago truncatula TaxID=3880 RepID=G7KKQ2_MEDTR|nr:hypothetical protein MTR_6g078200 [Medicago truncatula]
MNHIQEYERRYLIHKCSIKDKDQDKYLGNEYLQNMTDLSKAHTWIQQHVQPYLSQIKMILHNCGK